MKCTLYLEAMISMRSRLDRMTLDSLEILDDARFHMGAQANMDDGEAARATTRAQHTLRSNASGRGHRRTSRTKSLGHYVYTRQSTVHHAPDFDPPVIPGPNQPHPRLDHWVTDCTYHSCDTWPGVLDCSDPLLTGLPLVHSPD